MAKLEVQLRDFEGGLTFKETIADAFLAAQANVSIWKISWTDATTGERVRLVRRTVASVDDDYHRGDVWVYEPLIPEGVLAKLPGD